MRFLNGYEIPYQAEDFFEVPGTSVQVSDKKFISIILCGNIADGSNYKQADISCPKCGKTMIRIPNPVQKLVLDKNYLKDQTHVYKTGDVLTEQKMGYHTSFFNIVSQEFYQYCERFGMNRSMVYEPVKVL